MTRPVVRSVVRSAIRSVINDGSANFNGVWLTQNNWGVVNG